MSKVISSPFFYAAGLISAQLIGKVTRRTKKNLEIVSDLRVKGFSVVPDFIPGELCDSLVCAFDSIEDRAKAYENDRRIFAVERCSPMHRLVFSDSDFIKGIGEQYLGASQDLLATMAAKLYASPESFGSGGGWHRDSFLPQFKSICYLSDVSDENGPFEYVVGSHTLANKLKYEFLAKTRSQAHSPRYSQESVDEYLSVVGAESKVFAAPKGTLIVCDTSGIHRGRPISEGVRYAVTNYYKTPRLLLDRRARKGKIYQDFNL